MAGEMSSQRAGERDTTALSADALFPVFSGREIGDGAGGIEEDVVLSVVTRDVELRAEVLMRIDGDIRLEKSGIAQERGAELSAEQGELVGGGEDQSFVSGFVVGGNGRGL